MASPIRCHEFLYVAHNFPPLIGSGVARTEQNCKLLSQFGWKPTLLTATADNSDDVDSKYAEIGVDVLRASGIVRENRVRALPQGSRKRGVSLTIQLLRLLATWLLVPDRQVLWKFSAQRLALRAAKNHNWKCVFGTQPPITAAWIGKCIAQRLQLPFVLEYRDIISDEFKGFAPTALHQAAIRSIERSLVSSAERIVVVSPSMKKWIVQKHNLDHSNVEVIPTGFSPEERDFFQSLPNPENERFTMLYAGSFQHGRKPDTVLKAVRKLIDQKVIPADKVRLIFIGNLSPTVISTFALEGVAETISLVPRDEVLKWYAQTDLLLLICDKREYQNVTYPGKLFEYLIAQKPILGLMDKSSDTAKVLEESGTGFVADAEDVEETAAKIEHIYKLWDSKRLRPEPNHQTLERFNCRGLVKRLAMIFDEVSTSD